MAKTILQKIEYAAIISIIRIINLFPFFFASKVAKYLGKLWFFTDKRRRDIALSNLSRSLGDDMPKGEIERIAKGSFQNLFLTIIEMARLFSSDECWLEKHIEPIDLTNIKNVKRGKKTGILLFTAHLGNWEFSALRYSLFFPLAVIARKMDNIYLEEKTSAIRTLYGTKVVHKRGALKDSLKLLREGIDVGILIDQNSVKREGVFVDFFGRPACTPSILAILALRTGAPVIPVFNIRLKNGRHRLLFLKEVKIKKSGNLKKDIEDNTAVFTKIIEIFVRQYPDQWLWMHRRWKTRP